MRRGGLRQRPIQMAEVSAWGYDAFSRIASASNAVAAYAYANSALGVATNETATIGGEIHTGARQHSRRAQNSESSSQNPVVESQGLAGFSSATIIRLIQLTVKSDS